MAKKTIFQDAEAGSPYARLGLAYMYHYGKNIDPDPDLAIRWYIRSSEVGCSRAKWELAKIFRDGTIAKKSEDMFILYLKAAAEAGVPEARMELGVHYMNGRIVDRDVRLAFEWVLSAANQGLPMAQFMIGYMYGKGIGTPRDISEQEGWYSKVGLRGDAELFYWIGRNFEYGLFNIDVDLFEAGRWYKFGADMGHEKCMICWRSVLNTLDGNKHDTLEEREFMLVETEVEKEKLERDFALTMADKYLELGDEERAFNFYQEAADLGNPTAMFVLAMMHHVGMYVKRNDRISLDLMSKASIAGSEDAQYVMGTLYEDGRGVNKDLDEAIKYYTMAAANGYLTAYYRLSRHIEHPEIHVRNSGTIVR